MEDNNIEPLIKLEVGGNAPVISYNVPDSTSYMGRTYINLELDPEDFRQASGLPLTRSDTPILVSETNLTAETAGDTVGIAAARLRTADEIQIANVMTPGGLVRLADNVDSGLRIIGTEPLSLEKPELDIKEIIAMDAAGYKLNIYRSMYGNLTYNFLPPKQPPETGTLRMQQALMPTRDDDRDPVKDRIQLSVDITDPRHGTTLYGSMAGFTLNVQGSTTLKVIGVNFASITKVEVRLGTSPFQQATPKNPGDWTQWSYSKTITQAGRYTVTAKVQAEIVTAGDEEKTYLYDESSIIIDVFLNQDPQPDDQTPPTVSIISPVERALVGEGNENEGVTIAVEGTAYDADSGVKEVKVMLDGRTEEAVNAIPKTENDWSSWSASLQVMNAGEHTITAHGTDQKGNGAFHTINVTTLLRPLRKATVNRLLLVEIYRLSSSLGNYGAGRVIKTFSLLPGEKTKISVKTYTRTASNAREASSILDSFNQSSATKFENTVGSEQTDKTGYQESFNYFVQGSAKASWGWGSASVKGGVSGGTNATREGMSKIVSNAVEEHASTASAKRDVQINTSYEVTAEEGEETSIEREIQNINLSRTLNFVFRQMNQEFITLLHLVDVRLAYYREEIDEAVADPKLRTVYTYHEATLPQIDAFLEKVIVESKVQEVRQAILNQLENIFDFQSEHHNFVESSPLKDREGNPVPGSRYLRLKKEYLSKYVDTVTGTEITVPGIIIAAMKNVMRTEGIIVEALLGQGEALDDYSDRQRKLDVELKRLEVERLKLELEKIKVQTKLLEKSDSKTEVVIQNPTGATDVDLNLSIGSNEGDTTIRFEDKKR